jgi:outer membrane biosynthesis protein TonB
MPSAVQTVCSHSPRSNLRASTAALCQKWARGMGSTCWNGTSRQTAIALLLFAVLLGASGCQKRTVHAATPAPPPAPPLEPVPDPTPSILIPPPPLETTPEPAPASPPVAPAPKPAPVKPHADAPKPAPPPQISPGLSPQEQATAEQRTRNDIDAAERNLRGAYGKQLNTAQHDLVEKIRGFLAQAHEAMRASDWVRARNLAQKAHVLSVDLLRSL